MRASLLAAAILAGIAGPAWADAKTTILTTSIFSFDDQWFKVVRAATANDGAPKSSPRIVSDCGEDSKGRWRRTMYTTGEGDESLTADIEMYEGGVINKNLRAGDDGKQHFMLSSDGSLTAFDGGQPLGFIRNHW
jgi:hypothetical protein